jgi:hypothetical protein
MKIGFRITGVHEQTHPLNPQDSLSLPIESQEVRSGIEKNAVFKEMITIKGGVIFLFFCALLPSWL